MVIVANNVAGTPIEMSGTGESVLYIPAFMISQSDGNALDPQLPATADISATVSPINLAASPEYSEEVTVASCEVVLVVCGCWGVVPYVLEDRRWRVCRAYCAYCACCVCCAPFSFCGPL